MSKQQQRFNRLVKEAARLKDALRAWSSALPEIHRGVAEHARLLGEYRAAVAELVQLFDRAYQERGLTKAERAHLRRILCDTARDLLDHDDTEELVGLKEIYNRHSRGDYDAEAAEEDALQARVMRAVLEQRFGFDFADADIRSVDDLEQATMSQMDEMSREEERRAAEAAERAARRKKSAREAAAEARREAERVQVGKALQDVYRKLAMALHPDREPDPEERARKTLLMQQINVAYEAKDLLQLLELQLRFEQIDEAKISGLADERIEHYNRLLAEQVWQLKEELARIEMPWRVQLDLPDTGRLPPTRVRSRLKEDLRDVAARVVQAKREREELSDLQRLKAWLQAAMAADGRRRAKGGAARF